VILYQLNLTGLRWLWLTDGVHLGTAAHDDWKQTAWMSRQSAENNIADTTDRLVPCAEQTFHVTTQTYVLLFMRSVHFPLQRVSNDGRWPSLSCQMIFLSTHSVMQCRIKILEAKKNETSSKFWNSKTSIYTLKFYNNITKTDTELQRLSKKYKNKVNEYFQNFFIFGIFYMYKNYYCEIMTSPELRGPGAG